MKPGRNRMQHNTAATAQQGNHLSAEDGAVVFWGRTGAAGLEMGFAGLCGCTAEQVLSNAKTISTAF